VRLFSVGEYEFSRETPSKRNFCQARFGTGDGIGMKSRHEAGREQICAHR